MNQDKMLHFCVELDGGDSIKRGRLYRPQESIDFIAAYEYQVIEPEDSLLIYSPTC